MSDTPAAPHGANNSHDAATGGTTVTRGVTGATVTDAVIAGASVAGATSRPSGLTDRMACHSVPTPTIPAIAPARARRRHFADWARLAVANRERGMSTAEYAVGTIAACAFAALLFKVVTGTEVQEMLSSLIDRALKTAG
ncbi:MAG: hypothetical protein K0R62_864 [Nonomuraea muscovyensis]|jgi:hypothetical protein|nr:hypothetical protein [Nonomuraea muscovyensis]